jgi:hypothetical protein
MKKAKARSKRLKNGKKSNRSKKSTAIEDAAFFKKKMEKGARMLSTAGLPKVN